MKQKKFEQEIIECVQAIKEAAIIIGRQDGLNVAAKYLLEQGEDYYAGRILALVSDPKQPASETTEHNPPDKD